jgi:cytokinin dehydrogenase
MDPNRRALLLAGVDAAAAGILCGASSIGTSAAQTGNAPPQLEGILAFDDKARAAAAEDFGHIVRRVPKGVLLPASNRDVATTIRWAGSSQRKVAARGQGHSVYGRAQVRDGIVIDMTPLRTIHEVHSDSVDVAAGATWSEVLTATLARGLTPPVLTDYLGLSVGGTVAVGGIGGTISRFGAQCDNVLEMEVITGTGATVVCSPRNNGDLFDAVRAGLGHVGVITQATFKLVAAPVQVRQFLLLYPDLPTMLKDQRLLAADNRFDALQGAIVPTPTGWMFRIEAVKHFSGNAPNDAPLLAGLSDERSKANVNSLLYFEYVNKLKMLEQTLRGNGQWLLPHPWLTTFVGDSQVDALVERELSQLKPADLGKFGQVVLSAFNRRSITTPLLRLPEDNLCYAFNLVRIPATGDVQEVERLIADNRFIYERLRAAGGTLYPVSAFPMSQENWRSHFGSAFGPLAAAKKKYDPQNVLAPGYEVF